MLQAERLLLHGMVDAAEEIYRNATERDPHNAIAVVGLARVALEHGDERLAYERALQALAIDPQNVAALRLEARLSEVLAARGETVERPAGFSGESSGQAVPTRNRSMAEARQLEQRRTAAPPRAADHEQEPPPKPQRRGGLVRRLLGRYREN